MSQPFWGITEKPDAIITAIVAGGGGGTDQTARDMAQDALNALPGKADKINMPAGYLTIYEFLHKPLNFMVEMPIGSKLTTTITPADIQEIASYLLVSGSGQITDIGKRK